MYAQIDSEGNQYQLLNEIIDHRSDKSAIGIADGFTTSRNGNRVPKKTTQGWSLLVSWKDGFSDWIPLKDLKDAYPIQIAEYAMANQIANEPPLNRWVHTVLMKRNRIVAKVKRYRWTTHKFGIPLPKTVEESLAMRKLELNSGVKPLASRWLKSNLPGGLRTESRLSRLEREKNRLLSVSKRFDVTLYLTLSWTSLASPGSSLAATKLTRRDQLLTQVLSHATACDLHFLLLGWTTLMFLPETWQTRIWMRNVARRYRSKAESKLTRIVGRSSSWLVPYMASSRLAPRGEQIWQSRYAIWSLHLRRQTLTYGSCAAAERIMTWSWSMLTKC